MKVYIAGAITNEPQYKEKFYDAVLALKTEGHITLNPSELPSGLTNADYMRICFSMIDVADMVALSLYPELKSDKLIEKQISTYVNNQEQINVLKATKLEVELSKWWLYFGGAK